MTGLMAVPTDQRAPLVLLETRDPERGVDRIKDRGGEGECLCFSFKVFKSLSASLFVHPSVHIHVFFFPSFPPALPFPSV